MSLFFPQTRVSPTPPRSPPSARARPSRSGPGHGERSWLASLRHSRLLWNPQGCKWERSGVGLFRGLNGAGRPSALPSVGKGGDALSSRCQQRRPSVCRLDGLCRVWRASCAHRLRCCGEDAVRGQCWSGVNGVSTCLVVFGVASRQSVCKALPRKAMRNLAPQSSVVS